MVTKRDVFVVGGGPAGLAAAIALRLQGFSVTVADRNQPAIDKACGEGLMPGALDALRQLGVHLETGVPFPGIRFLGENISVESRFPSGVGLGVRRTVLHQALLNRAIDLGVDLRWGTAARSLGEIASQWIVGADGEHSQVRRWAGLDSAWMDSHRFGYRRHYLVSPGALPRDGLVEVYWGPACQLYVTQVSDHELCVVAMSRDSRVRLDDVIARIPEFAQKLKGAVAVTTERGAVSASRWLRRVQRGNIALVGDASGSVDAITGEGLRLSFEQSLALADAMAGGNLSAYQKAHRGFSARPAFMANLMLSMDWSAYLRRRAMRAFASQPNVFSKMLAAHVGALSIPAFIRQGMIPLTRSIIL